MSSFPRDNHDALRSMGKYMSLALGDDWEVRFSGEEHTFRLPFCLVSWAGEAVYTGTRDSPLVVRPMQIDCYTMPGETVEVSLMSAMVVEELLFDAFRVGVGDAQPERIPFYNYSGVALDESSSDRGDHKSYLKVVPGSLNVSQLADPMDDRWIRVLATFRLSWHRFGRRILGRKVESLRQEFNPLR